MNTTDKKIVLGTFLVGAGLYIYMQTSHKQLRILGLDSTNSRKLVMGVTGISAAILAYGAIKNKSLAA